LVLKQRRFQQRQRQRLQVARDAVGPTAIFSSGESRRTHGGSRYSDQWIQGRARFSEGRDEQVFSVQPAARLFFFIVSLNIWLGIWLTGFGVRTGGSTSAGFLLFAA